MKKITARESNISEIVKNEPILEPAWFHCYRAWVNRYDAGPARTQGNLGKFLSRINTHFPND